MHKSTFSGRTASLIILLLVIILAGAIIIWTRYPGSQPIEITLRPPESFYCEINISGAVVSPGIYPVTDGETMGTIIKTAGGAKNADLTRLRLYLPQNGEKLLPQKVDINRAEAWLLKALPEIGDSRAKAIIEHRSRNGAFKNIYELAQVEGLGSAVYEKIKDLVTVGE